MSTPDSTSPESCANEEIELQLASRCSAAQLQFKKQEHADGAFFWSVDLPCGRAFRTLFFSRTDALAELLGVPFEQYRYLDGLAAIVSYAGGTIEAGIRTLSPMPSSLIARRIFGEQFGQETETRELSLELASPDNQFKVSLGTPTPTWKVLAEDSRSLCLRIQGARLSGHDESLELLKRVANALFFQIDVNYSLPLTLLRERRHVRRGLGQRNQREVALEFPRCEYDDAPLSLYWYGRGATGMPLLQFLAYYQVVEYYFPLYSKADASRRIRTILKDPTFRVDRDADISRILSQLKTSGPGFGDERAQLRATILECVDASELRAFLTESTVRSDFFSKKSPGLAERKLPIQNSDADLRGDVAERIYEIRCRIVHTKQTGAGTNVEMLLPFSPQAEQLHHDIQLMQFVARSVLVSASSPLHFGSQSTG